MRDIHTILKHVYKANEIAVVPGSKTFALEGVARQFATYKRHMVIQNGLFSFLCSQIFETEKLPSSWSFLRAKPVDQSHQPSFAPQYPQNVLEVIE
ncbi:hypothetical protein EXM22_16635 [Oceanispirochaeta crateris]|uniref:Uncharacterized protein n=1 Tax=Oceanispirochaeta crateris TaxID=2518645 RepID=A0A5C1QQN4_9SPIO|nr:hypothetical protein [Oceanispirochaeta crateris]QEN09529.1 hypothetical protein EXM22_16635 [Oceanispirochaeta crateris]